MYLHASLYRRGSGTVCRTVSFGFGWFDSITAHQFRKQNTKTMNVGHKLGRLRNRLARLKKKTPEAGADRQGQMTARIAEIEEILRKTKV